MGIGGKVSSLTDFTISPGPDDVVRFTVTRLRLEREDWQKAVFVNGLLAQDRDGYRELARSIMARAVSTQTTAGQLAYGGMDRAFQMRMRVNSPATGWWKGTMDDRFVPQTNPAALGVPLLRLGTEADGDSFLEAARRQLDSLLAGNRTSDGAITQYTGAPYLFVDGIYMICPFLTLAGKVFGRSGVAEEAADQFSRYKDHLWDPRNRLFRHVWCEKPDHYPQSTFWARGNGWVVAALADMLDELGPQSPRTGDLALALHELGGRLVEIQDRSGFWHNILDDPSSWLETSGTSLIAYGLQKAVDGGWLPPEFADTARRARIAVRGAVGPDGCVEGVAGAPGGPEVLPEANPTGQGAWLLATSWNDE